MPGFRIDTFGGMRPATDDRLLPDKAAAHSENAWLYSGRMSGIPQPSFIKALTAGTERVFRIPNNYVDQKHLEDSVWMEFTDPNTDVLRALVIDDSYDRYYWASTSHQPRYNTRARIANGDQYWLLGIPQNTLTSVTPDGSGVGAADTRAYTLTWVSAYGEEGPAATPVVATGKVDDVWNLAFPAVAATDDGGVGDDRNITLTRIYRTVTSASGVATYFLVDEIAASSTSYADTKLDNAITGNNQLESTNWIAPPTDLLGWVAMPNGILAGWRLNEVWFCEPYRPHAWPAAYTIVVDFPIVGLGVTNQTLVVCTQGTPSTITGVHPSSMAMSKSTLVEPCLSRGSILSAPEGVFYSSPNGIVFAGQGVIRNATEGLITKDKWQSMTTPTSLFAARLGNAYYAYGHKQAGVFDPLSYDPLSFAQEDYTGSYTGVLVDFVDQRVAFNLLSNPVPASSVFNDPWSGEVFIVRNDNVYHIDLSPVDPQRLTYIWRSKIFQVSAKKNLGALRVYWEAPSIPPDTPGDPPAAIETLVEFPALPAGSTYGVVRVYGDGVLKHTKNLTASGEIIRLPSGFKADFWQLEFETYLNIYSVQVGTSVKALRSV